MYRDTVTLFNLHNGIWRAAILPCVDLNVDRAAIIAKYGADCRDKATLHIRYTPSEAGPVVKGNGQSYTVQGGREYTGSIGTVAFRPPSTGEVKDFFLSGSWEGEDLIDDGAYENGFFDHLSASRDGVYSITSVARYSVIPHFEILGR